VQARERLSEIADKYERSPPQDSAQMTARMTAQVTAAFTSTVSQRGIDSTKKLVEANQNQELP